MKNVITTLLLIACMTCAFAALTGCSAISDIATDITDTTGIGDGVITDVEAAKIKTAVALALLAYDDATELAIHAGVGEIIAKLDIAESVSLTDIDSLVTEQLTSLDGVDATSAALVIGFAALAKAKIVSGLGLDELIASAEDYAEQVGNYVIGIRAFLDEIYAQTEA
jgi:hypothetical protein